MVPTVFGTPDDNSEVLKAGRSLIGDPSNRQSSNSNLAKTFAKKLLMGSTSIN